MQCNAWILNKPTFRSLDELGVNCLTVFVGQDAQEVDGVEPEIALLIKSAMQSGALGDKAFQSLLLPATERQPDESGSVEFKTLLLYRLPAEIKSGQDVRKLASRLADRLSELPCETVGVDLNGLIPAGSAPQLAEELVLSLAFRSYRFEDFKSKKKPPQKLRSLGLISGDSVLEETVCSAAVLGESINMTRDLGNMPGNACTPRYLAGLACRMAEEHPLETEILDEDAMQELGMGSLLSVSAGSEQPARLIVMQYRGGEPEQAPHVLVGKGITFDSGGISLKPGAAMDEMKYDMCGAASVFGALDATIKLELPINLVAIVAAAENMPGGKATKPGDIVTSMSGKTIEILNTDAEGRLVLCDALTYAARFSPASIVDIATLTGACVVALGSHASGLYANDDELAQQLIDASARTGDKAWRMPLWPEYNKQLDSNFADMANIGGREAGSVTAACFLSRFTQDQKWAHLDTAGTAWRGGKAKGSTGRPVRLLVDYLRSQAKIQNQ